MTFANLSRLALPLLTAALTVSCSGDSSSGPDETTDTGSEEVGSRDATDTGRDGQDAVEPPALDLDAGGGVHFALADDGALVLSRDGEALLRLPVDAFELGVVPSFDDTLNYDPYYLEPDAYLGQLASPPSGLRWIRPTGLAPAGEDEEGRSTVLLSYPGEIVGTLIARISAPGRVELRWYGPEGATLDADPGVPFPAFFRLRARADAAEGFYGLGEVFDQVEHRGKARAMHFEAAALESAYNERHVPIPLLLGTSGWGVFVQTFRPGMFGVADEEDDLVTITYGLGSAAPNGLQLYLFAEEHPLDLTRHYYEITGFPGAIAPSALGPWIWRDEVADQAAVEADLSAIRDLDLATTGYWIDRPYASAVNSFDFQPGGYPDPPAMMAHAADLGFAMALWTAPYLDEEDPDSEPLYQEAKAAGYFAPKMGTALARWGPPLDFSNTGAYDWWKAHMSYYTDLGFVGFKLDYAEEVIVGALGNRIPWAFADGTDELTMHRRYQLLYHAAHADLLPETGGFLLCRAGSWGDQTRGAIIWPGDIDATLTRHGEEFAGEDGKKVVGVGGLPAAVIAGSSLGPSGFPYFGSDTGGYRHAPPARETYVRWFEQTALSTVMQVGTNANDLPWEFGPDKILDEEMLGWYRGYARLHLRLFPYLWTEVQALATSGRPIQRPLGLAHPELGVHPSFTYLLGDDLLVAPVVDDGARSRTLTLPPGQWTDWWTGAPHVGGGGELTVDAPLERIPFFVRSGVPIPMLRPTIDTLEPVADAGAIDSFAEVAGPLYLRLAPGDAAEINVYDGTGASQSPTDGGLALSWTPGSVFEGAAVFEIFGFGQSAPATVEAAGAPLPELAGPEELAGATSGWTFRDDAGGTLYVLLAEGELEAEITR